MKVKVNDLTFEIEIQKRGVGELEVRARGENFNVKILNFSDKSITILINDKPFTFNFSLTSENLLLADTISEYHCQTIEKYQEILNSYQSTSPEESKREKILKSPMPGLITKILVKPGTKIKAGDRLLILEAMKMENEIRSDLEGVVEEVLVNEGMAVEKGASLLKILSN